MSKGEKSKDGKTRSGAREGFPRGDLTPRATPSPASIGSKFFGWDGKTGAASISNARSKSTGFQPVSFDLLKAPVVY